MDKDRRENSPDMPSLRVTLQWPKEEDFDNDITGEKLINPFVRAEYLVWTSDPGWGMTDWTEDRFKWGLGRFIKNQALEMCIGRADAEVVGFSIGYEVTFEQFKEVTFDTPLDWEAFFTEREKVFWISDVGVVPAWRGRGVGRLVVRSLVERVQTKHPDIYTIVLRTRENEASAVALYRGLGFLQIPGVHDNRYPNRIYFFMRLTR